MPFARKLCWSIQSRKATIASPTLAVMSRISTSTMPSSFAATLMAAFRAPPVKVVKMSTIANNPLQVRFSLSAVSSLILSFSVRLRRPSVSA